MVNSLVYGQRHEIGLNIGNGQSFMTFPEESTPAQFMNPLNQRKGSYYQLGVEYFITPKYAINRFKTGVNLNHIVYDKDYVPSRLTYATIPLGFDFFIGNKFTVIAGFSLEMDILLYGKVVDNKSFFEESKKRVLLSRSYNLGFGYKFLKNKEFLLLYQRHSNITGIYNAPIYSKFGQSGLGSVKGNYGIITLKILHTFGKK